MRISRADFADAHGKVILGERCRLAEARRVLREVDVTSERADVADSFLPAHDPGGVDAMDHVGIDEAGRRPEEHPVENAEQRRVGANAESDRRDHTSAEPWRMTQRAKRVSKLLQECVDYHRETPIAE